MPGTPIHGSGSAAKNRWQENHISVDRIPLETHIGKVLIPFLQLKSVRAVRSDVEGPRVRTLGQQAALGNPHRNPDPGAGWQLQ